MKLPSSKTTVPGRKQVISVSLDAEQVGQLDALRGSGSMARSQVIRNALREHLGRLRSEPAGDQPQNVVLLCRYRHEAADAVLSAVRGFGGRVKVMVHSHEETGLCLDIGHLEGNGESIRTLVHILRGSPGVEWVQVVLTPTKHAASDFQ